jgi:hypothetical protein
MERSNRLPTIIGISGILTAIIAFFLPFYETVLHNGDRSFPGLLWVEDYAEIEVAVVNGLHSSFAIVHLPLCITLGILLAIRKPNLAVTIVFTSLFGICLFLTYIGCSAGFGSPIPDTMLIGFHLMMSTEIALIAFSFVGISQKKQG